MNKIYKRLFGYTPPVIVNPPTGNYTPLVEVKVTYSGVPTNGTLSYTDFPYDKKIGWVFQKDDGGINDYDILHPLFSGGRDKFNRNLPGLTYTTGTGGTRKYGLSFAINGRGNTVKDGSNNTIVSWDQMRELKQFDNYCWMNHTADHSDGSSTNPLVPASYTTRRKQLTDNEDIIKNQLGIDMRTMVPPAGAPGFVEPAVDLGYLYISSQGYNDNGAGIYQSEIQYNDAIRINSVNQHPLRNIVSRGYLDEKLKTDEGLALIKADIDAYYARHVTENQKMVFNMFTHSPDTLEETLRYQEVLTYIKGHPGNTNGDSIWFPTAQDLAEYFEVKHLCPINQGIISGNTITYQIDMSALPAKNRNQSATLKVTGGTIVNVQVKGVRESSFNATTGLVNFVKYNNESTAVDTTPILQSIAILGADSISEGSTRNYTAVGTYSDNTTKDITTQVEWTNAFNGVVTIPINQTPGDSRTISVIATLSGKTQTKIVNVIDTTSTGDRITGEIPYDHEDAFVLDNSNHNFTQFFNGNLDTVVDLGDARQTSRPDVVFHFPEQREVILTEIWFGDGQHTNDGSDASQPPVKVWTLDPVTFEKTLIYEFKGPGRNVWIKHMLPEPIRTNNLVFEWAYPIPSQLKFFGSYKNVNRTPAPFVPVKLDRTAGAVTYIYDVCNPSGGGINLERFDITAKAVKIVRLYIDLGNLLYTDSNGKVWCTMEPMAGGAWSLDSVLAEYKRRGIEVILCLKGGEGSIHYSMVVKQLAIRYGRNTTVADTELNVYTGPGYPANQIKKGLNLVIYIQLGNEQSRWWKGRANIAQQTNLEGYMTPREVYDQHKKCYDFIKAVDATFIVVAQGTPANTPGIMQGVIHWCKVLNNGQLVFDAVAFHMYINENGGQNTGGVPSPKGVTPETNNFMKSYTERFRRVMHNESPNKRIEVFITETGYSIANKSDSGNWLVTNPEQTAPITPTKDIFRGSADMAVRCDLEFLAGFGDGCMKYQLHDDGAHVYEPHLYMNWDLANGILQSRSPNRLTNLAEISLRPAADFVNQYKKEFGDYYFTEIVVGAGDIRVYKFTKAGSPDVYSLHKISYNDSTTTYQLPATGTSVTKKDFNYGSMAKLYYYTQPESPLISYNAATKQVTATHRLQNELEVRIAYGQYQPYDGLPITLDVSSEKDNGYLAFRTKENGPLQYRGFPTDTPKINGTTPSFTNKMTEYFQGQLILVDAKNQVPIDVYFDNYTPGTEVLDTSNVTVSNGFATITVKETPCFVVMA